MTPATCQCQTNWYLDHQCVCVKQLTKHPKSEITKKTFKSNCIATENATSVCPFHVIIDLKEKSNFFPKIKDQILKEKAAK